VSCIAGNSCRLRARFPARFASAARFDRDRGPSRLGERGGHVARVHLRATGCGEGIGVFAETGLVVAASGPVWRTWPRWVVVWVVFRTGLELPDAWTALDGFKAMAGAPLRGVLARREKCV